MRKRLPLLLALVALLILNFAIVSFNPVIAGSNTDSGFQKASELSERIKRVESGLLLPVIIKGQPIAGMQLADRMRHYNTPGVSIAVINNGDIEWARGYGMKEAGANDPVTTETMFQAASISKPVAAMGALVLVEKGKLSLDEDVNQKLVSWKVTSVGENSGSDGAWDKKVTLRSLVTHSAGLTVHGFRGYASDEQVPTTVQVLDGQSPANSQPIRVDIAPGSKWRYSGGGYTVMQLMMSEVTRKPFPELMQEFVLGPLGMKHSTYQQPLPDKLRTSAATGHLRNGEQVKGKWHTYPEMAAAGLWTTPSDLARFAIELQKARAGKSNKVLSKDMAIEMTSKQFEEWGLGPSVGGADKTSRFSHGGSNVGFKCIMIAYNDTGQGAVIMTNGDLGSPLASEIIRSIAREYDWPDYRAEEKAVAKVNPEILRMYAGRYSIPPNVTVTVTNENGNIFIQAPPLGPEKMEMYPESDSKFFLTVNKTVISFVKDEHGEVKEIIVHAGGQPRKGARIK